MIKKFSQSDFKIMPWSNNLGSTMEIFKRCDPGTDKYLWRVSLADVANSGPFSKFEGYQRVIAVAEGAGMILNVAGNGPNSESATLRVGDDGYCFDGAASTDCTILDGPIRDFNLIFDPTRVRGRLLVLSENGQTEFEWPDRALDDSTEGQAVLAYVFEGSVDAGNDEFTAGQARLFEGVAGKIELRSGLCFVVAIQEVA